MIAFAAESALHAIGARTNDPISVGFYEAFALIIRSFEPGLWILFSLLYSRGNSGELLRRWRWPLVIAFVAPVGLALGFSRELVWVLSLHDSIGRWWIGFGWAGKALNILLLISAVAILMNVEQTFRAAVGTMRWQIKFLVLGLVVIFGVRIYTGSQEVLFSGNSSVLADLESVGLLVGCTFMALAYVRAGFAEIDVYPSQSVLRTSFTLILVGAYLFVVGVLAQTVGFLGGVESFQAKAILVLLGISGLAVLMLSDRLRRGVSVFVSRHFRKARHDSLQVWTRMSRETANLKGREPFCEAFARLISETFQALSVTIWLIHEREPEILFGASTVVGKRAAEAMRGRVVGPEALTEDAASQSSPYDLEAAPGAWAETLRALSASEFPEGGARLCLPVVAGGHRLAFAVLADRVNGAGYTPEEMEILRCMGEQFAAGLLNLRLGDEIARAKELEAFQSIAAFFVHDMKNAASTLTLMLQNLPVHFDDPSFRQDALRGIANTVGRINHLVERLSVFRGQLKLNAVDSDLNALVREALSTIPPVNGVILEQDLQPLQPVRVDREQLQSVIINLLLNAREAIDRDGRIKVETRAENGYAVLSVTDDGCGMSPAFLKDSLFRPFQSTKKKGLGIGMFQSRMIVDAHRGNVRVASELGKGTTFHICLPLSPGAS